MIQSFADKRSEAVFNGLRVATVPPDILRPAQRKLKMLHYALDLNDLRIPPANRLEALQGNRKGQFSIRINRQWRICFVWRDGKPMMLKLLTIIRG